MNAVDRLIELFAPQAALRREKARVQLSAGRRTGYWREAAQSGKTRQQANQSLDHGDSPRNHIERIAIMREARFLSENSPVIKSILLKLQSFVVGRLSYSPRTSDEAINKTYKNYVSKWMEWADFTGRRHFRAMMGMGVSSMARDGDIGFIEYEDDDILRIALGICPIRLHAVEADRIGSMSYGGCYDGLKPVELPQRDFSGVVVNAMGKPIRYRISPRKEGERQRSGPAIEIPAESFYLLTHSLRFDAYRGMSAFDSAINDIKDAREILGYEKISQKYLASVSGIIKNADGKIDQDDLDIMLDPTTGLPRQDVDEGDFRVDPGAIRFTDGDFKEVSNNRPSQTFNGFLNALVRNGGLSINLPFGFIYDWNANGTAVRMEAATADREITAIQRNLEQSILNRLVRRVLTRGIELRQIPYHREFDQGEWHYPKAISADLGRDSRAAIEERMAGLTSTSQICQEREYDAENIRQAIKDETIDRLEDAQEIATRFDISLEQAVYMLERRSPNPPAEQADTQPME